jgi:hypothetical protein
VLQAVAQREVPDLQMSKSNTCNSAKVQVFLYTKSCSMHEQEIDRKIGGDF